MRHPCLHDTTRTPVDWLRIVVIDVRSRAGFDIVMDPLGWLARIFAFLVYGLRRDPNFAA